VERAILTHGHADHARPGHRHVLAAKRGVPILAHRIGRPGTTIEGISYGDRREIGDAIVSLHPAGHVLGSAQVRIEVAGRVWVFSGDYARTPSAICEAFEPVRCDRFISECTFGLPVYRWPDSDLVEGELRRVVRAAIDDGRHVLIGAYALGKAQRLLMALLENGEPIAPILCHGAVTAMNEAHHAVGVTLPETRPATRTELASLDGPAIVVAPPSALAGPWRRAFDPAVTIAASGWMAHRASRRRATVDHAFVLSDHVDWPGLLRTVEETGCTEVGLTHGFVESGVRWFRERGLHAVAYDTRFTGSGDDQDTADTSDTTDAEIAS
jgi:putative mRNA 3-end processing factor